MANGNKIIKDITALKDSAKAVFLQRFFKTDKGQYGYGDRFLGLTVPQTRTIAKKHYVDATLPEIQTLLQNRFHEVRLCALHMLVYKYQKEKDEKLKKQIYTFYLKNTKHINNWDLVDTSCRDIVGAYLYNKDKKILTRLAKSKNMWERRIAIVSTWYFITKKDFPHTYALCTILMNDKEDLLHKACGWMLREAGKYGDRKRLAEYLEVNKHKMPRTMLRYAIEHFSESERKQFLNK